MLAFDYFLNLVGKKGNLYAMQITNGLFSCFLAVGLGIDFSYLEGIVE